MRKLTKTLDYLGLPEWRVEVDFEPGHAQLSLIAPPPSGVRIELARAESGPRGHRVTHKRLVEGRHWPAFRRPSYFTRDVEQVYAILEDALVQFARAERERRRRVAGRAFIRSLLDFAGDAAGLVAIAGTALFAAWVAYELGEFALGDTTSLLTSPVWVRP